MPKKSKPVKKYVYALKGDKLTYVGTLKNKNAATKRVYKKRVVKRKGRGPGKKQIALRYFPRTA